MEFGETLKEVRHARNLNQEKLAKGLLSRTSLSKIENNKQIPAYDTASKLITKLGLTTTEFNYIANNYQWTKKQGLINEFFALAQTYPPDITTLLVKCQNYLATKEDLDIKHIQLALVANSNFLSNFELATKNAALVWNDLEKFTAWTKLDLFLVNSILQTFPTTTAVNIAQYALKIITKKYPHLKYLQAEFLNNCAKALMTDKDTFQAKKFLYQMIPLYQALSRYDLLAFTKFRLALCDNDKLQAKSQLQLLQHMGATFLANDASQEFMQPKN